MTEPTLHHVHCSDSADGHRMAWWQWGDDAAGHLIVCAHGLSRQGRDFDVLSRALVQRAAEQGRALRVVCPDVVGRGESDWLKDPMGYQFTTYVGDMLGMLNHLNQKAPIHTLDWVGTSMGGIIGMSLAGMPSLPLPVAFSRLLLNDVGPSVSWAALERIGQYLGKSGTFSSVEEAAEAMRAVSTSFGPHTDEQWMALSRPMIKPSSEGGFRLHYDPAIAVPFGHVTQEASVQAEAALWQIYDQITAETLVLRGADSDLLTPETVRAMEGRGPRPKVIEFAGVGHAPTLVAGNQVRVVLEFLLPVSDRGPEAP